MTTRYVAIRRGATGTSAGDIAKQEFNYKTFEGVTVNGDPSDIEPIAHFLDQTSEDIGQDRGLIFPETSAQRVMRNKIAGQVAVSGDIQVPLYPTGTTTMIYYAMGLRSTEGSNHRITNRNTAPRVFQMEIGKDRRPHQYVGCVVRTMTIDYDPSEVVLVTFGIMCNRELKTFPAFKPNYTQGNKNESYYTLGKYKAGTGNPGDYNIADRAFGGVEIDVFAKKGNTSGAWSNGDMVKNVESFNIEVDNGFIDDNYVIGDRHLPNAYIQNFTVNGSMELGYSDNSDYVAVLNEQYQRYRFLAGYGSGGTRRKVDVELPQIALKTGNLPTEGTDRYLLNIDWEAERKGGTGADKDDLIIIDVANGESAAQIVK